MSLDLGPADMPAYEPPAIVRLGAVVDVVAELEKAGLGGTKFAYVPGDPVDWSHGRVS